MDHDLDPDDPTVQGALAAFAAAVPHLEVHAGAKGHGKHPYVSGDVAAAGGAHLQILRSVRWHEHGVALWLAAGPYGAWSKPFLPDVDHQEGGLVFLPDTGEAHSGGLLADFARSQSVLHDLWVGSKWSDPEGRGHDGLAILVRPDAIVAHLHSASVTADALESLVSCLPDVAKAAEAHDVEWSTPIHPPRDQIVWPAMWVALVAAVVVIAYLAYLAIH